MPSNSLSNVRFNAGKRTKRKKFRLFRFIFRFVGVLLLIVIFLAFAAGFYVYKEYSPIVEDYYNYACRVAESSTIADFKSAQTSYIYNSKGKQIAKLKTDRDVNYLGYSSFPDNIINALVAVEDKRFWEHQGVDWLSTTKAGILYLKNRSSIVRGGSTITQQLTRNIYLSYEKSIERKAKEIFIALQLEKKYTKKQILEFYLNNVNYANGYYGIASAAKGYFNKKVAELSLEEASFLIAIPNNPTYYNPLNNIKHTVKRKNLILKLMLDQGYISQEEYLKAVNSPIHFYTWSSESFNYETSYAVDCSVRILMERQGFKFKYRFESDKAYKKYRKKYEEEYQEAKHLLYTGGYKVYTTLRPKVQHKLQKIVDDRLSCDKSKMSDGVYGFQGAATVIDNSTGNVIAIVGGRSQNFKGMITFNRAYQAFRQPGSTFKPLIVYTPAFEYGYKPDTIVNDEYFPSGPKNSDGNYLGEIPLRTAVEKSKNVVAWNLFNSIGPKNGLAYVQQMMFSHIVPDDYYLSSSLGGLTYGVSTVEMASGYATLANDGVFREPTCIKSIRLSSGEELDYSPAECRVYSENAAREITDVLRGVPKRGTARGLTVCGGMPIACKTGTTNKQTNGWFCGYTPYYTVSCYVGFDQAKSVSDLWGSTYPMDIWKGIQDFLCKDKEIIKFKKPKRSKSKTTKNPEPEAEPEVWSEPVLTSEPVVVDTPEPSEYLDDDSYDYLEPDDSYDGEDYYNIDSDYETEESEPEPEEPEQENSDESEPEEPSSEIEESVDDGEEPNGDNDDGNVVIDEEE